MVTLKAIMFLSFEYDVMLIGLKKIARHLLVLNGRDVSNRRQRTLDMQSHVIFKKHTYLK